MSKNNVWLYFFLFFLFCLPVFSYCDSYEEDFAYKDSNRLINTSLSNIYFSEGTPLLSGDVGWLHVPSLNDFVYVYRNELNQYFYIDESKKLNKIKFFYSKNKKELFQNILGETKFDDPSQEIKVWKDNIKARLGMREFLEFPKLPDYQGQTVTYNNNEIIFRNVNYGNIILLNRNRLFDNIMGVSEYEFRKAIENANQGNNNAFHDPNIVQRWFLDQKNRGKLSIRCHAVADIVTNEKERFEVVTLHELRRRVEPVIIDNIVNKILGTINPRLENNTGETDFRYMHENNFFKGAAFQTASTFTAMEGAFTHGNNGKVNKNVFLHSMNKMPVQGEEAALSAMGLSIYLHYFHEPINLLDVLQKTMPELGKTAVIQTGKSNLPNNFNKKTLGNLKVAVASNIIVTSGYFPAKEQRTDNTKRYRSIFNKQLPVLSGTIQTVSHIITAAHDIKKSNVTDIDKAIAKMLLEGAYEATILSAIDLYNKNKGSNKLVLTFIGGSAFANPLDWHKEILGTTLKDLIIASGLEIFLVFHEQKTPSMMGVDFNDMFSTIHSNIKNIKENNLQEELIKSIISFFEERRDISTQQQQKQQPFIQKCDRFFK